MLFVRAETNTPAGPVVAIFRDGALIDLGFVDRWEDMRARLEARYGPVQLHTAPRVSEALGRYVSGQTNALATASVLKTSPLSN